MNRSATALCACLLLASCATPPGRIKPTEIPTDAYHGMSCQRLSAERAKVSAALTADSKKQHDAVAGDTFGVLMLGVPMASVMGEDKEAAIAVEKGKLEAIDNARMRKRCGTPS